MKRVGSFVVASAMLSVFLASASAESVELDVNAVSDYSALLDLEQAKQLLEQVTSINQFNDVRPTDWSYQALLRLVRSYGCVAGYPSGRFRGSVPITRYEAAALLSACLDRVTEMTDEVEKLVEEFESELNYVSGSIMLMEDRVGVLEGSQFSTTTKLQGKTTFAVGATQAKGTRNGSKYIWDYDKKYKIVELDGRDSPIGSTQNSRSWKKTREAMPHRRDGSLRKKTGRAVRNSLRALLWRSITKTFVLVNSGTIRVGNLMAAEAECVLNGQYGATTFSYEQKLNFKASFTGKDLLYTSWLWKLL